MKALSTTVSGNAVTLPTFYNANVTPNLPARLVTCGQFPALNPNWYRAIQISDEYVFVKHGANAVAISLNDLVNIALVADIGLTWTPPVVLADPQSDTINVADDTTFTGNIGSELSLNYRWLMSANGSNWSNAANVANALMFVSPSQFTTNSLTPTAVSNAANNYQFKLHATDSLNGSVNTNPAVLTVN
jgi:hypothetical protein